MGKNALRIAIAAAIAGTTAVAPKVLFAQEGALEEIVVTATRRAQDLQEVPVSIVAITGDNLEMQGLDSLEDVGNAIPNINIQGGGAGTYGTQFRVRGLPNVGVYIDGVWQVGTNGFLVQDFVDVDRIEVLRGPQGTTYGRDSVGGAIRIWTRAPDDELGGQIQATTGSYDRRDVRASINVPITDNFRTKWTASSQYRDGFIEGLTVSQDFGMLDQEVFRGDMVWEPSDSLSFRLIYSNDDLVMNEPRIQDGIFDTAYIPGPSLTDPSDDIQRNGVIAPQFYGLAIEGAALRGVDLGLDPFEAQYFQAGYPGGTVGKWENRSNASMPSHIWRDQTTLDINWDITDSISIQFLTAATNQRSDINVDWENSDYTLVEDITRGDLDLFSEEINLQGGGDRINWSVGAYYWDQSSINRDRRLSLNEFRTLPGQEGPQLLFSDAYNAQRCVDLRNPATNPNGLSTCESVAAGILANYAYDRLGRSEQDGYAVYGEMTIGLTDRLDLTLGTRYHDQTNLSQRMVLNANSAPAIAVSNTLHIGDPFIGSDFGAPSEVQFDQTTYKAALQMQFTDDIMGYMSYSEGFDSGGISQTTTSVGVTLFPYEPQIIKNTEFGIRSDLAGGMVRLNATVFFSDWTNIQNAGVVRDPGTGEELPQLVTTNVGEATADGIELEFTLVPTDNLTFNINVGLLDTEYTDIAAGTFSLDESTEFAQAPELTYNIGLQHVADLANGGSFTSRLDYSYTDQFWRSLPFLRMDWYGPKNNGPVPGSYDESGDWGTVNARFTYEPAGGEYAVSFFGTNLTNEYMLNSGFFHGIWGYNFATVSRPREVGASLTFRF